VRLRSKIDFGPGEDESLAALPAVRHCAAELDAGLAPP
jgi:hypothetical protein